MKLLILSSNNGQGHNTAARALLEAARKQDIEAVMMDGMLFDSPKASERVARIHVRSALYAPHLFEKGTRIARRMEENPRLTDSLQRSGMAASRRLLAFIRDNEFDTVIATHIFSAQVLTHVEDALRDRVRTAFVITDYSYIPFTSDTALDAYILPHKDLVPLYEWNAPGKCYLPLGIPTSPEKLRHWEKEEARRSLGLPQGRPTVLIMTGSMGFGDVLPLCAALLDGEPRVQILALCGRNEKLLSALKENYSPDKVLPLGYTEEAGKYMDAADVLLSKPGGLSSTEAAVKGVPLVHMNPLPGWEEDNVRFFTARGMSLTGKDAEEMARSALMLLKEPATAEVMHRCQQANINPEAAREILVALDSKKVRENGDFLEAHP